MQKLRKRLDNDLALKYILIKLSTITANLMIKYKLNGCRNTYKQYSFIKNRSLALAVPEI